MGLFKFKFFLTILILGLTLFFGWLPIRKERKKDYFDLANYFAYGIFLGTAVFHLFTDAVEHFRDFTRYPYLFSIFIVAGFYFLMFVLEKFCDDDHEKKMAAYLLTFSLSTHAFIEGLAIGINQGFWEIVVIFLAVFIHKGSESFAYTVALKNYQIPVPTIKKLVLIFTLMTPLGILTASGLLPKLFVQSGHCYEAVFNAVAAGTFLYLCGEHLDFSLIRLKHKKEIFCLSIGFLLMALLSILV